VKWELEHVFDHGLQDRLFVLTPPAWPGGRPVRLLARLLDELIGWSVPSWTEFADHLWHDVHVPPVADPGPGAVLTFRADRTAILLSTGLRTPAEFVEVIAQNTAPIPPPDHPANGDQQPVVEAPVISPSLGAASRG